MSIEMEANKRLFKKLKNGKDIRLSHDIREDRYSIWISYKNEEFEIYSFIFEGSDVMDEKSYTNEERTKFKKFDEMIKFLNSKFPQLKYER